MTEPAENFGNVVIRASAGTGKTFQLTNRFIRLLLAGVRPDEILATTFTRKAGGEIFDRVLQRLADAAASPAGCVKLKSELGVGALDCTQCLSLLSGLIHDLDRLRIVTIDSFFNRLALSCSFELGLPFGWHIADDDMDRQLQNRAIHALLQTGNQQNLLTLLRYLAKGQAERPVSGEILELVDSLHTVFRETDHKAWHALPRPECLNNEALKEALARLRQLGVPNAFRGALETACENIESEDWESFLGKGLASKILNGESEFKRVPIPPAVCQIYLPLIEHAKAILVSQLAAQTEATYDMLEQFDRQYQQLKRNHRALRFDDVTQALAFNRYGFRYDETVRLGCRVNHLLLDEFQDTSLAQFQVLRPFVSQITRPPRNAEGAPASKGLFCVGDMKQAIYGWRGGVAEIFDALGHGVENLQSMSLTQSYRSSAVIVQAVNQIFGSLPGNAALDNVRDAVLAWAKGYETHTTAKNLPGYARLVSAPEPADDETGDVTLAFAAQEIQRLAAEAPSHSIGVLTRSNKAVGTLINALAKLGVPASEEGGNHLGTSPAVSALLSLFLLADHPGDKTARFHVARSPLGAVVGLSRFDSDLLAAGIARDIRAKLLNEGYGPTTLQWVEKLAPSCDERDLNRLLKLVELAYRYEELATLRARDFVSYVESQKLEDPILAQVRVMTIHKSKGLEFDVVVLPDLEAKFTPQAPMIMTGQPQPIEPINVVCRYPKKDLRSFLPDEFQRACQQCDERMVRESLCVLYVALTRGIHAMHMIIPPSTEAEKRMPPTFAGMLRAALTDGARVPPGKVLFETGDKHWFQKIPMPPPAPEAPSSELKPVDLRLKATCSPRSRGLGLRTPSGSQGGNVVKISERLRLGDASALSRGSLFHAWFELVEWLDDGPPSDGALKEAARRLPGLEADLLAATKDFRRMLNKAEIRGVLSRKRYLGDADSLFDMAEALEVWRERPFAVRDGDSLLRGTFDRVVVSHQGGVPVQAEVIDFKTDVVPADPQGLDALVEHYRPQMTSYRQAVSALTGLSQKAISARLLFVSAARSRVL